MITGQLNKKLTSMTEACKIVGKRTIDNGDVNSTIYLVDKSIDDPKVNWTEAIKNNISPVVNMVKDYTSKKYTEVPWVTITLLVGTLVYLVSPIDAIPDFIPFAGFADDAALITAIIASCKSDLDKYKMWKESTENTSVPMSNELVEYLDVMIGSNEADRNAEIQRLASAFNPAGDSTLPITEQALQAIRLLNS